ncbi:structural protein [Cellulophaga phage phi39:1]|uniref:structural protein n=1 Tax=Cellulophaga phage phi39:1 TaxID=1327993 RepID=UPI0003517E55|nr:structural protein [Cellulophaga phage phi39:1]AGO49131.1 structural protein [Cellulophaga phage phi39:1]
MNLNIEGVEGFEELNAKLKKLSDSVKRKEVLGLQRQLAKPIQKAYAANLPVDSGTLSKSVAIKTVSIKRSGGNPVISVEPGKRGKNDGYYKFMVIKKGSKPGSIKKGSRRGLNNVVTDGRNKTLKQISSGVVNSSEATVVKYVQKKIDKLSK